MATITALRKDEIPVFVEFVRDCFRPRHILSDPAFVRWQHWTPWDDSSALFVIRDRSGRIIAHDAGVAVPFWRDNRGVPGRMSMSLMSRPEARGFGLGMQVVRHVRDRSDVTLALAMNPESLQLHRGLGFHAFGSLLRYLYVTDEKAIEPLLAPGASLPTPPASTVQPLGEVFDQPFDRRFTALFERTMQGRIGVQRSAEYLSWRYRAMPYYEYEARIVGDDAAIDGLLVWRRDITEPTGTVVGRMVELIGEPGACAGLVAGLIAKARSERIAYLDAFFLARRDGAPLERCGFVEATGQLERLVTHWTHPARHSENPSAYTINAAAYCRHGGEEWTDRERWYVTRSDTDQDRPATIP
jgi:hypothetical protein